MTGRSPEEQTADAEAMIERVARSQTDYREGDVVDDPGSFWHGATVISVYTRAQAIEDGALVDVTEVARESGFTVPVALTAAAWHWIEPTEREEAAGQSARGRLDDLLAVLHWRIRTRAELTKVSDAPDNPEMLVTIALWCLDRPRIGKRRPHGSSRVQFKVHSGPGDDGEHVLTIMLPSED